MKLSINEGFTVQFRKTKMVFKTRLSDTGATGSTIVMTHPANIGPALHLHPNGAETFFVLEGSYTFWMNDEQTETSAGDFVCIPANIPHRYTSGAEGGKLIVHTPPSVENYFIEIAELLKQGEVSAETEFECAKRNGQLFLTPDGDFGHK
ncbi:MAG: cupin domain-containing protein [Bacteroidia bacterium]